MAGLKAAVAPGGWEDLYDEAALRLGSAREARWMVEEVGGEPFGLGGRAVRGGPSEAARHRFAAMVERRLAGEPLQYVLGSWAFRRLELTVDRRVLIPRPETEQVVEVALSELDRLEIGGRRPVVVDLGTGSGAIAISIGTERSGVEVWATDISADALEVARLNVAGQAPRGIRLAQGDWWAALPTRLRGQVDLVVSNPPYIAAAEMEGLDAEVREWEPRAALEAGASGTEDLEEILAGAGSRAGRGGWLRRGGTAVIEIAPHQAEAAISAALAAGFAGARVDTDLAGRPRALVARNLL